MKIKKHYTFSKTLSSVADVIVKVKSMESLTDKEEFIYCTQIKGMTEEHAERSIQNKLK